MFKILCAVRYQTIPVVYVKHDLILQVHESFTHGSMGRFVAQLTDGTFSLDFPTPRFDLLRRRWALRFTHDMKESLSSIIPETELHLIIYDGETETTEKLLVSFGQCLFKAVVKPFPKRATSHAYQTLVDNLRQQLSTQPRILILEPQPVKTGLVTEYQGVPKRTAIYVDTHVPL